MMSNGRKMGFLWGLAFGASIVLTFELHWSFVIAAIISAVSVYAFRDNDYHFSQKQ
jgi:hypothetical protein